MIFCALITRADTNRRSSIAPPSSDPPADGFAGRTSAFCPLTSRLLDCSRFRIFSSVFDLLSQPPTPNPQLSLCPLPALRSPISGFLNLSTSRSPFSTSSFLISTLQRERFAFTSPKLRGRSRGFTLLELLVVIGIISILLVAVIPAVTSLSKSSGRKGALSNLLGAIEQARALAIKDGRSTYVAFVTSSIPATLEQEYAYRAYAIFEDDASNPNTQVQVTNWKKLPIGISFRAKNSAAVTSVTANGNGEYTLPLQFSPGGTSTPASCHCIEFTPAGEVLYPSGSNPIVLGVFEGTVTGGVETSTSRKDAAGEPLATEYIQIARLTGRAEPTAAP